MNASAERPQDPGSAESGLLGPLILAYVIWCSALAFVYALHAIGCAFAWPVASIRLVLGTILLVHLVLIGWLWFKNVRTRPDSSLSETGSFLHWVAFWTLATALLTTILTLSPALVLKTCV